MSAVSAVSAAGGVLLLDLALLALLLAVVVLKMQNTRPDRASPTGRSRNGRATPIPTSKTLPSNQNGF